MRSEGGWFDDVTTCRIGRERTAFPDRQHIESRMIRFVGGTVCMHTAVAPPRVGGSPAHLVRTVDGEIELRDLVEGGERDAEGWRDTHMFGIRLWAIPSSLHAARSGRGRAGLLTLRLGLRGDGGGHGDDVRELALLHKLSNAVHRKGGSRAGAEACDCGQHSPVSTSERYIRTGSAA